MRENFDENLLRRYLLGDLSEDRQSEIEDAVFADADVRAMLDAAEQDLIDEYAADELTAAERERFERMFFNSAERRQKIEFAATLAQMPKQAVVAESPAVAPARANWWKSLFGGFSFAPQMALAAFVLLSFGFAAWFFVLRPAPGREIVVGNSNQIQVEPTPPSVAVSPSIAPQISPAPPISPAPGANANAPIKSNQNAAPTNRNSNTAPQIKQPSAPAQVFAALVFPAGLVRDNNAPRLQLVVPPNVKTARLVFNLERGDEFPVYQIEITAQSGASVATARAARRNRAVAVNLPAAKLPAGSYTATLRGIPAAGQSQLIGYYDFVVR